MIKLERIENRTCPIIYCDKCGKRIKDAGMAMVSFSSFDDGNVEFKILHKITCDIGEPLWMELDRFLYYMLENAGFDEEKYMEQNSMGFDI